MSDGNEARILKSWTHNVTPWTTAVRQQRIDSRRLVTDTAIVEAVLSFAPETVLDIGCGEGWLLRALSQQVQRGLGVDATEALIAQARAAGGGEFRHASYDTLVRCAAGERFDLAVANFSLLGKASVTKVFADMQQLLVPGGVFIVQTLHPQESCGKAPYVDGWRDGAWPDTDGTLTDPPPWYFRTLASWIGLFLDGGLELLGVREPLHPATGRPASILFIARHGINAAPAA
ncbi:class I SAM-dependent methyltransferase [Gilvimarinus algae]|uniref:Class I SAM-dependent methyltransferase n=1 Tax=Gilvimarinus algae TaxID=3058037 RepID=A0ABT8TCC6_9GAMM|nr:class I SAM-dependent methyltransferase [Gilvimarinus sp. SDUM040014]MDO3381576.1 class I SAM-dependent methyltransferase [Gilvimarinus sp. SDUM040014]